MYRIFIKILVGECANANTLSTTVQFVLFNVSDRIKLFYNCYSMSAFSEMPRIFYSHSKLNLSNEDLGSLRPVKVKNVKRMQQFICFEIE